MAFGAYHMFVLTEEGVVFTLGDNEVGQQGIPISTVKIIKTPM
jgi:alpha-tubulin suppressor-like RCC1 family protein